MKKYHAFNNQTIVTRKKRSLIGNFLKVYAEEPPVATTPEPPKATVNYEDLIAKARKEEKDKLYLKITTLETDNANLIEKNNAHLIKIGTLEGQIADMQVKLESTGKDDSKELKDLKDKLDKATKDYEDLKASVVDTATLETQIRGEVEAEYEVKLYREQKLGDYKDKVIPELVTGTTKEEIDLSLVSAQERFNQIVANATKSSTRIPPVNTNNSLFNAKDFNINDLAKMDPRSPEYKEMRKQLGLK